MAQLQAGNTPLYKSIELTGRCDASVYVKREDKNLFGTFKDRRCAALLETCGNPNAIFVHITSGNSGYSMGKLAEAWNDKNGQNVQVVNVVDRHIPRAVRKRLEECSIVHRMDLSKTLISDDMLRKIAVDCVRERTSHDANETDVINVESHGLVDGYRQIIKEIAGDGVKPTYIFCPVGGGELATELATQAAETWVGDAPKIIGVTIKQNILTRAKELLRNPGKSIADKLVSGYSKFKSLVGSLVEDGKLELRTVNDGELAREYKWLNEHGISAEPSAAAAFCGAVKYDLKPTDTVVIINTGKGIYDQSAVEKRWLRRLARGLKYTAIALGTAAALTAAGWGWLRGQEKLIYSSYANEAMFYAGNNQENFLNDSEAIRMCKTIPNKDTTAYMYLRPYGLPPNELEYYVLYKRAQAMNDAVGRSMMNGLRSEWEGGKFRCKLLHPDVPFLYERIGTDWFPR